MRKRLELECDRENKQTGLPIGCRVRIEGRRQGDAWIFVLEQLRWGTNREEQVGREIEISALNSHPRGSFKKAADV